MSGAEVTDAEKVAHCGEAREWGKALVGTPLSPQFFSIQPPLCFLTENSLYNSKYSRCSFSIYSSFS
jgi:hypothetical protein